MQASDNIFFENNINVCVDQGLSLKVGMIDVFDELKKEIRNIHITNTADEAHVSFEYNFVPGRPIVARLNSQINYAELSFTHELFSRTPQELILPILSIVNRYFKISKVMQCNQTTINVSSMYSGEFTKSTFKNFVEDYMKDIYNMHLILADFQVLTYERKLRKETGQKVKSMIRLHSSIGEERRGMITEARAAIRKYGPK